MTAESCHRVGVFASSLCARHFAANRNQEHFIAFSVSHHGSVSEAAVSGSGVSGSVSDGELSSPSFSVVF